MIAEVDIWNAAIELARGRPITDPTTADTAEAGACRRHWRIVRNRVFAGYPWNCLLRRARLPAAATAPSHGFAQSFALPEGPEPARCLRVVTVGADIDDPPAWQQLGRTIESDGSAPLPITYGGEIADPGQYDPHLVQLLVYELALAILPRLTESSRALAELRAQLVDMTHAAKRIDARTGTPPRWAPAHTYVEARG